MLAIEFEIMRTRSDAPSIILIVSPKYRSLSASVVIVVDCSSNIIIFRRRAEMMSLELLTVKSGRRFSMLIFLLPLHIVGCDGSGLLTY